MLDFRIDGKGYQIPSLWSDISLKMLYRLEQLCTTEPIDQLAQNRELLSLLGGVPSEIVDKVIDSDIGKLSEHFALFVNYITTGETEYVAQGIAKFKFDNQTYLFPDVGLDIIDKHMPGHKMIAEEFCNATDIALFGGIRLAPVLVAIMCREDGEAYDPDKLKDSAKVFDEISAEIYFEARAYIGAMHDYFASEYPYCYNKQRQDNDTPSQSNNVSTWSDRILFVADNRPSELAVVERMSAYDFMRLCNSRIRAIKEQWTRSE